MNRRSIVLAVLAGAGLALVSAGRPWVGGRIADALLVAGDLHVTGATAAPGLNALALVAAAGAVVVATGGRRLARATGVLLALAGAAVVLLGARVLADPADSLRAPAAQASGTTTSTVQDVRSTPWAPVGMAGGVLILAGGLLAVVRAPAWGGPRRSYDRAPSGAAGGPPADDEPLWEAISRGEDPTARDGGQSDLQQ